MARIRSIKPEYWHDRKLAKRCSRDARLLYVGLWNLADEHARLNGDPDWIKGQIYPYEDDLDAAAVAKLLEELADAERIVAYESDGDPYLFLPNLARHQRLEPDKVESRLPPPPDPWFVVPPPDPDPDEPAAQNGQPESRADSSERRADEFAPDADKPALLYVAGSMEHVRARNAAQDAPPRRKRATRIPDDFTVTPDMVAWAKRECPHVDGRRETEKFANYWHAKSGQAATKLDWVRTWRNWMLTAAERLPQGRASPAGHLVAPADEWKANRS